MNLKLKPLVKPYYSVFMNDYLAGENSARDFFQYDPTLADIQKAAGACSAAPSQTPPRLLDELRSFNLNLGASKAVEDNLRALGKPSSVVIATGQQPGLLTGSLYTIYKIIQVICLARKMNQTGRERYVPLFWTASNDHQPDEVNNFSLQLSNGDVQKISISINEPPNTPYSSIKTRPQYLELIKHSLIDNTHDSEFKQRIISLLDKTFQKSDNLAEWFNLLLGSLFFEHGLIIFDPVSIPVAAFTPRIFLEVMNDPGLLHKLTEETGQALESAGYKAQVPPKNNKLPFFIFEDNKRWEVSYHGKKAHFNNSEYTFEQIADIIIRQPQRVTPNVFLRPLIQQALFRVAAYVGGPAETAYHAQLKNAYSVFDLTPPVIWPRVQIFLEDSKSKRLIKRYQLDLEELRAEPHRIIYSLLKKQHAPGIEEEWQEWLAGLNTHLDRLSSIMASDSVPMRQKLAKFRKKTSLELTKLNRDGWAEHRKKEAKTEHDLHYLHNAFFPDNTPAERVYNIFPLLIKYGPDLIAELLRVMQDAVCGAYVVEWTG